MGQLSSWELDATEAGNGAKWVGLQYPTGDDGRLDMVFGGYGIGNTATVVSTAVPDEKLEIVMRALDYAYQFDGGQGEGFRFWNFGKQGESWELDANGEPAYTDLVVNDPNGLNAATDKYGGAVWNGSCIQATLLLYLKNTETAIAANDLWFYPNEEVTAYYTKPRGMSFTEEESNAITDMEGAIRTYVEEAAVAFMTGQRSLADVDSYLAELEGMGLAELLSYYQASYDRYLAR
jgi:putative aldouronate transport system substrate-binding protein